MPAPKAVVVGGVEYPSIGAAARANYMHHTTLLRALSHGCAESCGLSIRYAYESDSDAAKRVEPRASTSCPVRVDGVRYPSMRAAARGTGLAQNTIFRALKSGKKTRYGEVVEYDER